MNQYFWSGQQDDIFEAATSGFIPAVPSIYHEYTEREPVEFALKLLDLPEDGSGPLMLNVSEPKLPEVLEETKFNPDTVNKLTQMEWLIQQIRPNYIAANYGIPGFGMHMSDSAFDSFLSYHVNPPHPELRHFWDMVRGVNFSGYDPYKDDEFKWKHDRQVRHAKRALRFMDEMEIEHRFVSMNQWHSNTADRFTMVNLDELYEIMEIFLEGGCNLVWWGLDMGPYYAYNPQTKDIFWRNNQIKDSLSPNSPRDEVVNYLTQMGADTLEWAAVQEIRRARNLVRTSE